MKIDYNKLSWYLLLLLIAIYWMLVLSGCVTEKRCNAKYPPQVETITNHTKEVIRKDSILQGATIVNTIYKDSIVMMPVNQWRIIKDTSGKAELRWYKDAYGNINAQCIANSQMIEKLQEIERKGYSKSSTKVITKKEVPVWFWWLFIAVILLALKFKDKLNRILKIFM